MGNYVTSCHKIDVFVDNVVNKKEGYFKRSTGDNSKINEKKDNVGGENWMARRKKEASKDNSKK